MKQAYNCFVWFWFSCLPWL